MQPLGKSKAMGYVCLSPGLHGLTVPSPLAAESLRAEPLAENSDLQGLTWVVNPGEPLEDVCLRWGQGDEGRLASQWSRTESLGGSGGVHPRSCPLEPACPSWLAAPYSFRI